MQDINDLLENRRITLLYINNVNEALNRNVFLSNFEISRLESEVRAYLELAPEHNEDVINNINPHPQPLGFLENALRLLRAELNLIDNELLDNIYRRIDALRGAAPNSEQQRDLGAELRAILDMQDLRNIVGVGDLVIEVRNNREIAHYFNGNMFNNYNNEENNEENNVNNNNRPRI